MLNTVFGKAHSPLETTTCSEQSILKAKIGESLTQTATINSKPSQKIKKTYSNLTTNSEDRKNDLHEEDSDTTTHTSKKNPHFRSQTSTVLMRLKPSYRQGARDAFSLDEKLMGIAVGKDTSICKKKLFRNHSWSVFEPTFAQNDDEASEQSIFSWDLEDEKETSAKYPNEEKFETKSQFYNNCEVSQDYPRTLTENGRIIALRNTHRKIKKRGFRKNTDQPSSKKHHPAEFTCEEIPPRAVTGLSEDFHLTTQLLSHPPSSGSTDQELAVLKPDLACACCNRESKVATFSLNSQVLCSSFKFPVNLRSRMGTIAMLDKEKIFNYITQQAQEGTRHDITEEIKLQERLSDEPFLLTKKGEAKNPSYFTTNIRGVNLDKLLNMICEYSPNTNEKTYLAAEAQRTKLWKIFLLSHDIHCSSIELLIQLIKRFFLRQPNGMSKSEAKVYEKMVRTPRQYIVLDLIATWIELRGQDFYESAYLGTFLRVFIEFATTRDNLISEKIKAGLNLLSNYEQKNQVKFTNLTKRKSSANSSPVESQIMKIVMPNTSFDIDIELLTEYFLRYSPRQIAAHMTKIDYFYLKSLRVRHLPHNSKNLEGFLSEQDRAIFINHTNSMTFLLVYLIIGQEDHKIAKKLTACLIETADFLLQFCNFQSFSCVMGAITNTATKIYSQNTKIYSGSQIKKKKDMFEDLSDDKQRFRSEMKKAPLPKIPSIEIVIGDIIKLQEKHDVYIESDSIQLINFKLMEEVSEIIDSLNFVQKSSYLFREVIPELEAFLIEQPKKLMNKLDCKGNINHAQAELMRIAGMKSKSTSK